MSDQVIEIYTDRIKDPEAPMRTELERNALFELSDNIKQNGLINPITVRPVHVQPGNEADCSAATPAECKRENHRMFEVVAGHRRLSACKIAGILKIKCVVRELTDDQTFAIMAAENLERADVDPVDEAIFISRFIEQTGKSTGEVAKALRRSVQYVETRIAIGSMPDYMKAYLKSGDLKLGAALALAQIDNDNTRRLWVDMAVRDGVSVAQAEYWLHGYKVGQLPGGAEPSNPPEGYEAAAAGPVMFRCAIDDKEYDARTFKSVMIHEANIPIFAEFVRLFRTQPVPTDSEPSEAILPSRVG